MKLYSINFSIIISNTCIRAIKSIARRVRECNVYSEIVPHNISIEDIKKKNPKGIIFTGSPSSVSEKNAIICDKEIF